MLSEEADSEAVKSRGVGKASVEADGGSFSGGCEPASCAEPSAARALVRGDSGGISAGGLCTTQEARSSFFLRIVGALMMSMAGRGGSALRHGTPKGPAASAAAAGATSALVRALQEGALPADNAQTNTRANHLLTLHTPYST